MLIIIQFLGKDGAFDMLQYLCHITRAYGYKNMDMLRRIIFQGSCLRRILSEKVAASILAFYGKP